jgi:general nucleoside transport system ATP-binding protein
MPLLQLSNITKRFPGVVANDAVSLSLEAGEILALLGENGAGKSTLMSILYGLYRPDAGEIRLHGSVVQIASPSHALKLGIGLVPQHPLLVSQHSVAENLALGQGGLFPTKKITPKILELAQRYGLQIDPNAKVLSLSPGEKQRVEILRCLLGGASVLILDEPTSVLTPQEAGALFAVMRELRAAGKSVIFISHKLEEVLAITDRIVVLRRGQVVGGLETSAASKQALAELMVGRSVDFSRKRQAVPSGVPLLEVQNLSAHNSRGLEALRDVSFTLLSGQVLGVAGVAGNGQSELIEVLAGLHHASTGTVQVLGQPLVPDPAKLFAAGVAHIPEDRIRMGTVPTMSVAENLALRRSDSAPFAKRMLRDLAALQNNAAQKILEFDIKTPSPNTPCKSLSGGNIQKVILARELEPTAKLILAVHPTYGLDIGATDAVHSLLLERTKQGAALLLVSEDLEELLSLSDQIAVLYHGQLKGPFDVASVSREQIGLYMTGAA